MVGENECGDVQVY